jgi:hypothetical protein
VQAHRVGIDFFGQLDPVGARAGRDLHVGGVVLPVEGVDHVIRGEGIAVVELDPLAQLDLDGDRVGERHRGREVRLDLA